MKNFIIILAATWVTNFTIDLPATITKTVDPISFHEDFIQKNKKRNVADTN